MPRKPIESKSYLMYLHRRRHAQAQVLVKLCQLNGITAKNAHGKEHIINTPQSLLMMLFDNYVDKITDPYFHQAVARLLGESVEGDNELTSPEVLMLTEGDSEEEVDSAVA